MRRCPPFLGVVRDIEQMRNINMIILFRFSPLLLIMYLVKLNSKISDADLHLLEQFMVDQIKFYKEGEPVLEDMLSKIAKIYGGTPDIRTNEGVAEYINGLVSVVSTEVKTREQDIKHSS